MAGAGPDSPPYQAGWTCLCGNHATVTVEPRTWAGINKQGGVGTIVKYHLADDTFDIKLILRGRDNRVARNYLSCYDLTATPGQRKRPKREFYDPRAVCVKRAKTRADATASDGCQEPDEPSVPPAAGPQRRHASLPSAPRVVPLPPPAVSITPCHGHLQQDAADNVEEDSGTGGPPRPRAQPLHRSEISTDDSSTAVSSMISPMPDQSSGSRRMASRPSTASPRGGAQGVESDDLLRGAGVGSSDIVQGSRRIIRSRTTNSSTTSAMMSFTAPSTTATTSAACGVTAGGCSTTSSSAHNSRSKPPTRTTRCATASHHTASSDSRTVDTIIIASTADPATAVSGDSLGPVGGYGKPSSRTGGAAPSQSSSLVADVAAVVIGPSSNHADVSGPGTSNAISDMVGTVVPRSQVGNTSTTAPNGHGDVESMTRAAGTTIGSATARHTSNSNAAAAAAVVARTSKTHVATRGPGMVKPGYSTTVVPSGLGGSTPNTSCSTTNSSRRRSSGTSTHSHGPTGGHGNCKHPIGAASRTKSPATPGHSTRPTADVAAAVIEQSSNEVAVSGPGRTRATLAAAAASNPSTAEARVTRGTGGSNSTTTTSRAVRTRANTVTSSSSSSTSHCSDIRTIASAVTGGSTGTNAVRTPTDLVPAGVPAPVVRTQSGAPALLRDKTHTNTRTGPAITMAEPIGCENFGTGQSLDGVDEAQKTAALPSSRTAQVPREPMTIPGPNTTEMNGVSNDEDECRLLELSSLDLPSPPPRRSRCSASTIVTDEGGPGRFYEFTSMLSELMGEDKVKETHLRQVASSRGFAEREVTGFLRTADDAGRVLIAGGYVYHC